MRKLKAFDKKMQKIYANIEKLERSHKLDNKEIFLFGVTREIQCIVKYITKKGFSIKAFLDNAPRKKGGVFMGIPILGPEDGLSPHNHNAVIILCSAIYFPEQSRQLEMLGYVKEKDFFVIDRYVLPYMPILNLPSALRIIRGYFIYKSIMNLYGNDFKMLLCPYAGSGDSYLIGTYLAEYLKKEGIDKYIIVASGNIVKRVLILFSINNVLVVNEKKKNLLLLAYQFLGREVMNFKPLLFWDWRVRRHINVFWDKTQVTFNDDFKYDVFELDESAQGIKPIYITKESEIEVFFEKHGLIRNKTVILAPYMGIELLMIPTLVWETIAKELTERGFVVCTNSADDEEVPVKGTKAIFFPYKDAVPIVNAAGYFISIRSGLCDIVSSACCKMAIVYESSANVIPKHYFGLKNMGLNDNVFEIEYDGLNDHEFVKTIISYIVE